MLIIYPLCYDNLFAKLVFGETSCQNSQPISNFIEFAYSLCSNRRNLAQQIGMAEPELGTAQHHLVDWYCYDAILKVACQLSVKQGKKDQFCSKPGYIPYISYQYSIITRLI